MPPPVLSFDDALRLTADATRTHLLLGNGFSIALKPDIFSYGSLFENVDFSAAPEVKSLFDVLNTQDFEVAIHHLQNAAKVLKVYRPNETELNNRLTEHCNLIKDALVSAIAKRHPDRPYVITKAQYKACRQFLQRFDHIFTLNYDVLLYWTLMQDEVDQLNLRRDDGFRHPEDDPNAPYVSWQQGRTANVIFLHGALHLFDNGTEIIKYTWSKTDVPIVEQIRTALDEDKFPLFVAEGSSASKAERILHNAYLHKGLRSFEACCGSSKSAIVIFGHSLHENDMHILRLISAGGCAILLIGIHGDSSSMKNQAIMQKADELVGYRKKLRGNKFPLKVTFYNTETANVWD